MGLVRTARENDSNILPFPFTQTHHKQPPPRPKKAYRMRGQIYSQSGSWVIWLDAFLEWSFLSILLSFSEVSSQLPPLPQHSSLLFILYKYNRTGKQPPPSLSFSVCPSHIHMYENTYKRPTRTHLQKSLLTKRDCQTTIALPGIQTCTF